MPVKNHQRIAAFWCSVLGHSKRQYMDTDYSTDRLVVVPRGFYCTRGCGAGW